MFGTRSENLKTDMADYLRGAGGEVEPPRPARVETASPAAAGAVGPQEPSSLDAAEIERRCRAILEALGGAGNVGELSAVARTRLRARVADDGKVSEAALRKAGAHGVMRAETATWHVLVGLGAELYDAELRRILGRPA